jgi:hypothetical protein
VQLIVQLRPEVAAEFHTRDESQYGEASNAVRAAAQASGCELSPLHPGTRDPSLLTYFQIETADRETAERLQQRLAACDGVAAAYGKPPDAMP